ncbi:MAG: AAA family ATPase [Candidatus Poribacteria bacterium]|nr:AAA family ATPase [Candidatus Poribacteria bacterium]
MPRSKGEGITKIAVKGFKSIAEECTIDIRPLTILAGANSSGKSSIMQPLLMLKQTLEAPYDPGVLLIDGPNVQFTFAEQFLSTLADGKRSDRFHIRIESREHGYVDSVQTIFRKGNSGIEISKVTGEKRSAFNPPLFSPEHVTLSPDMPNVTRSKCTLELLPDSYQSKVSHISTMITDHLNREITKSIHLRGLRGNPERTYKLTGTSHWYPGTFESYVAGLIHEWQERTDKPLETLGNPFDKHELGEDFQNYQNYSNPAAILAEVLDILGLTGHISAKKIGDARIELQVGRLLHHRNNETDMVNIADTGLGVSQVLPVLVALIVARPSQLVYLEQPELHLHPRAQVALARVLADAAKRGVRIVAETHSSLLLLGVQTLVAEGDLSPELVKLHWFTRREDGITEVNSADLDEAGAYGEWPEDFDDVDLKAQSRYIKAAQSRFIEGT